MYLNGYNIPYEYSDINEYTSQITPSVVHQRNTGVFQFFQRYLFKKALSVFKWSVPETWNEDFTKTVTMALGTMAVFNTAEYGVINMNCTLGGRNLYYQPKWALITNPSLKLSNFKYEIGNECELIKLQPDYTGIMDVVNYYAGQMEELSTTFEMNTVQARNGIILFAKNKNQAESWKKAIDKIQVGENYVILDDNIKNSDNDTVETLINSPKTMYLGSELLDNLKTVEDYFCTIVGIKNANTQKKERLIKDEVNANNQDTQTLAKMWLDSLQKSIERCKKMFPEISELSVDWAIDPNQETLDIAEIGGDNDESVL